MTVLFVRTIWMGLVHAAMLNMSSLESFIAGEPCGSLRGVESLYEQCMHLVYNYGYAFTQLVYVVDFP